MILCFVEFANLSIFIVLEIKFFKIIYTKKEKYDIINPWKDYQIMN